MKGKVKEIEIENIKLSAFHTKIDMDGYLFYDHTLHTRNSCKIRQFLLISYLSFPLYRSRI